MDHLLCGRKSQRGAATLIIAAMLLLSATMIVVFAAGYSILQQKMTSNILRNNQAFAAAEAGLEFGINYLQQNSATILANPSFGRIRNFTSSSTTNVVLPDSSRFSITYTNPNLFDYTLIQVSSTGTSDDGTATRVVRQQVQFGSLLVNDPRLPLLIKGNLTMAGNAVVSNTTSNTTIRLGGNVTISNSAKTIDNDGTSSTAGNIRGDIKDNISSISSMSTTDFFATYFGVQSDTLKNQIVNYYLSSGTTDYSSVLNSKSGTTIWIEQPTGNATLTGSSAIGTAANPVLLIVNGNFVISGNVTINGFVFVSGTSSIAPDLTSSVSINGEWLGIGDIALSGNTTITRNATIISTLQNSTVMRFYAKIPGSWRDF